ncbi:MAG: topoisomerase IV [Clostridiales bacterium]|jgi:DNA gyrase subunit A|nr:topoisomerase IV [Clostridiales bacterium]
MAAKDRKNIINQDINDTLEKNFMPYAMSVIVSRAIPEMDGFKPSHRKLLYTMYKMGLLTGRRVKSADIVGQTMTLNPHGDGAIYETLVRLTRGNAALNHPFIDSKGNFGKQYSRDMAYAASRYTEAKLDDICAEIFKDIEKNTVDFIENYNATTTEPVLFPTTFPNLLVTVNQGIAVGMASSVPSFNLAEVCSLTAAYIKGNNVDVSKYLTGPDFSTGGQLLYSEKDMQAIYETGRGSVKLRAKYRYDKKNSLIEIYEIPYTTTIEAIIDKIAALVKAGKLREINDVRDETDLKGLKITIDIKRSANPEHLMHRLFQMTTLSDSFSCNFNFLVDGKPRTMGIKEILEEWLLFRIGTLSRSVRYDLKKKQDRLHLMEGLSKILLDIDKAIKIIRGTEEDSQVVPNLMKGFDIDELQADFIAEIKLRNLNKQYILKQVGDRDALKDEIAELAATLDDPERVNNIIIKQLKEIAKKYGKPRMTEIITETEAPEIPHEVFIDDYPIKLFLTDHNFFKKISHASLRASSEQYLKDDDIIIQECDGTNKSDVIFFSDKFNAYKAKAHELPDCKASSLGEFTANMLKLPEDERIVFMAVTTDYSGSLIMVFENGKAAKVALNSYSTKTNRKKLINAYSDKSPLIFAEIITEDTDIVMVRGGDKAALINTSLLEAKATKNTSGLQLFEMTKKSKITQAKLAEKFKSADIEYYRVQKLPSSGHYITDEDKIENNFGNVQLKL